MRSSLGYHGLGVDCTCQFSVSDIYLISINCGGGGWWRWMYLGVMVSDVKAISMLVMYKRIMYNHRQTCMNPSQAKLMHLLPLTILYALTSHLHSPFFSRITNYNIIPSSQLPPSCSCLLRKRLLLSIHFSILSHPIRPCQYAPE